MGGAGGGGVESAGEVDWLGEGGVATEGAWLRGVGVVAMLGVDWLGKEGAGFRDGRQRTQDGVGLRWAGGGA